VASAVIDETLSISSPLGENPPSQINLGRRFTWRTACLVVVAAAVLIGIVVRAWYLTHVPINSDGAVAGLMAKNILQGHFQAFYWGQDFGGVEPYVIAVFFAVFGQSALWVGMTPVLLTAGTAIVAWRIALRLVDDGLLAALVGALVWAAPATGVANSTIEYGFRSTTMFTGTLSLLLALRMLDGRKRFADCALFGLVAGVSWWSSPESIYLLMPSVAILIGSVFTTDLGRRLQTWVPRVFTVVALFSVGALPWLWSNLLSGFPSLHVVSAAIRNRTYLGHLRTFFSRELPIQLGLHRISSGTQVLPGILGAIALIAVELLVAGLLVLCLLRPGRGRVIGLATLAFPFLYAASPLSWWWSDGRFAVYFPVLLALTSVIGFEEMQRFLVRRRGSRQLRVGGTWGIRAMTVTAAGAIVLSVSTFLTMPLPAGASYLSGWSSPDGPTLAEIRELAHDGVRFGYANYWVAYRLDFLSGGKLELTPRPGDTVRSWPLYRSTVAHYPQAWLFVPARQVPIAGRQFGTANLETGYEPESKFLSRLDAADVPYRMIRAGSLNAIIPERHVTAELVGMGR
jgi:Dolichyl-phosphate-mannose-protein mannosyltransferase